MTECPECYSNKKRATPLQNPRDWVMAALDLLGGRKPAGEFRYMEMIGPDIL